MYEKVGRYSVQCSSGKLNGDATDGACLGVMSALSDAACARSEFARQARPNASPLVSQPNLERTVKTEHARSLQRSEQ